MRHLVFRLSMPHCGSWNGKWSQENEKHTRARTFTNAQFNKLPKNILGQHFYRWDDGWEACVNVELVDAKTKKLWLKNSAGFCGYDWMIDSILKHGKILKGCS